MPTPPIFVSHSHHDNAVCRQIVADLRASFPDAHIFYDESELHAGDEWQERIQREVIVAPLFLVILSPQSVVARWVKTETNLALNLAMDDPRRKVIPLRITPGVDKTQIIDFVPLLILRQIIDLTDAAPGRTPQRWADLAAVIRGEASEITASPPVAPAEAQRFQTARDLARQVHDAVTQQQWAYAVMLGQHAVTLPGNERDDTLWGEYAQALAQDDDLFAALMTVTTALALNDARPELWHLQAQCLLRQGDTDGALAAWQQAFFRTGNVATRLDILAEEYAVLLREQRWSEAQRLLKVALPLAPHDAAWQARARDLAAAQGETARRQQAEARRKHREVMEHVNRVLPASLGTKGFAAQISNGIAVIISPTVAVPAGPFLMGSDKRHDVQAYDSELPQHTVTLDAYRIGTYPLTVAEYACFVTATQRSAPSGNPTWGQQTERADHPVVNVSWEDVVAYAQWLSQMTGRPWRLPTEAEWEKAARGTDGRVYPWGNQWEKTRANTSDGGAGTTTPVGAYVDQGDASPYGAHDLAGNVWEWCSTRHRRYPYKSDDGREDMSGRTDARVLRGGAWNSAPQFVRGACRGVYRFVNLFYICGARLLSEGVRAGSS